LKPASTDARALGRACGNETTFVRSAQMGVDESGIGDRKGRAGKRFKILGVLRDALRGRSVGVIEVDAAKGIASAISLTVVPSTASAVWAKPSFSQLSSRLIPPCRHSVTAFDTCAPARAKPQAASSDTSAGAASGQVANPMKSTACTGAAGGNAGKPAAIARRGASASWR